MKEYNVSDRIMKDLIQIDRPSLLYELTGGVKVREFLNVEFQHIIERRADVVARLEDDSLFHLEIQGQNNDAICYRMGIYCLLISEKYRLPVKQTVLYLGGPKMRMKSELDAGGTKVSFRLIDIREIDADRLLQSGCAGDLALAMLANGGTERLAEIARRASELTGEARVRVLSQLILLSGLRGVSEQLKMEITMGSLQIDIRDNVILREVWEEVMAEGIAEGKAKGDVIGKLSTLRRQLKTKFGHVPKWVEERLEKADKAQVELWLDQVVIAESLEGVIGEK